jgi:hypothetical protein
MHTENIEFLEQFKDPKEEMCKKFHAEKRKRLPDDYQIIETSDRRYFCPIKYSDSQLNVDTGTPIILIMYDPCFDPPSMGGHVIEHNYNYGTYKKKGGFKIETKIIDKYFRPIPKFSFFAPSFALGNETSRGSFDQKQHLLYFEDIIDVHWLDIVDIKLYRQMVRERIMPNKYLCAYFARWYCKENGRNFVGPMGIGPTADMNMLITDDIAGLSLTCS